VKYGDIILNVAGTGEYPAGAGAEAEGEGEFVDLPANEKGGRVGMVRSV